VKQPSLTRMKSRQKIYKTLGNLVLRLVLINIAVLLYSIFRACRGTGSWRTVAIWLVIFLLGFFMHSFLYVKWWLFHRIETLALKTCPACGTTFGAVTALQAKNDYSKRRRERTRAGKASPKLGPFWHVQCSKCQETTRYHIRTFEREDSPQRLPSATEVSHVQDTCNNQACDKILG